MSAVNVRKGESGRTEGARRPRHMERPRTSSSTRALTAGTQSRCLLHFHGCRWRVRRGSESPSSLLLLTGVGEGGLCTILEDSTGTSRRHLHLPRQPWAAVTSQVKVCSARLQALVIGHGQREEL